ncbi:MAG: ABC transporter permease [Phycisphaerales bacterium]
MYILLLPLKYLTSKIMPLLAAVAVLLCTMTVLTVWSVMGGFLDMLIGSGRTMTGDVIVAWPNSGFAYYDDLVKRLEKDPQVAAAAPMIESYGMLGLPTGRPETVQIRGVDGPSFSRVTGYADILWWRKMEKPLPKDKGEVDLRLKNLRALSWDQVFQNGLSLSRVNPKTGVAEGAAVLGIAVSGLNRRLASGVFEPQVAMRNRSDGSFDSSFDFMPVGGSVTLTLLPLDDSGKPSDTASLIIPVANEYHSGQFELDDKVSLVRLDVVQKMLKMDESPRVVDDETSPDGYRIDGTNPARVTHVLIRGKGDYSKLGASGELVERVRGIYAEFAAAHERQVPDAEQILVLSWEDLNGTMISAVQKETSLVLFLFSMVSLVSVILVLSIFWAMISEKTKDIGILRAIGASRAGVASVWLCYGLAIGITGSLLGLAGAYGIVRNINPIHEWLGEAMGIVIWDPRIYYFTNIPNRVDNLHAVIVGVGGVLSCFVGAIIPAARAAAMHPVRALRFE